jgi:hypothetical protein
MKFLGVSGVFDYAGLNRSSRYRACSCCLPRITRASASGLSVYGAEYPPRLSSVYASLSTSRYPAQDSRPSGSLLLSRKELSSSASCRFSPAHRKRLTATVVAKQQLTRQDFFQLLQVRVLGFRLLPGWDVGISIFPEGEKVLIRGAGLRHVTRNSVGAAQA